MDNDKLLRAISEAISIILSPAENAKRIAEAITAAGFVVVPMEPTEAMEDAGAEAYWDMRGGTPAPNNKHSIGQLVVCAYKAMVLAAAGGGGK